MSADLNQDYRDWKQKHLDPFLAKAPERRDAFETSSGIPIDPLYVPVDLDGANASLYLAKQGFPGDFPFTRGIYPNMYRGRFWTMRQYAGFGTARQSNERYRFLLGQGQTGLSVAFDLPTQIGYDSDSPMALGEVGKTGVAIDTVEDMALLFDQIPLDQVTTSMTINSTAAILLGMYLLVAERQGVAWKAVGGTIQNDLLKEYIARKTYIYPPGPSLRIITDIFAFCSEHVPKWNTISISGYHIREAGSTAAQEIGFTLANGIAYVQAAIDAGLAVDDFAKRLSFFFNSHSNFFEEVAKFRAARRLWAHIMRDRFGAKNPKSWMLRFHTQTAGSTLTSQYIDGNVVRTAMQAFAAVAGGTQSLHTNGKDEALALPTEASANLALKTQQIIAHETGVADTVDPFAGSYFVESLTDQLETAARAYIQKVDDLGGAVPAIEQGFFQREIGRAALEAQRAIETGDQVVVGVNKFQVDEATTHEAILKVDESIAREQVDHLRAYRAKRDQPATDAALAALETGARGNANLMALIVDALRASATLGEISDTLRRVFGEYHDTVF